MIRQLALAIGFLFAVGCAPRATFLPGTELSRGAAIAVLPPKSETPLARERLELFRRALTRGLESSGYRTVSEQLVRSSCKQDGCPERAEIAARIPAVTFAELTIDSVNRINILAGYYNSISGTLVLSNSARAAIVTVPHTEGERGGFLFNTGQVLQGLGETVTNITDTAQSSLSERFVRRLIEKLPSPSGGPPSNIAASQPTIRETELIPRGFSTAICVEGDPGNSATVVRGRSRASLAELTPGRYCGAVPSGFLQPPFPRLELVTPIGQRATMTLPLTEVPHCGPEKRVARDENRVYFICSESGCVPCPGERYLIFKGPSTGGPFRRIGPLPISGWEDRTKSSEPQTFAVVRFEAAGAVGAPVILPPTSVNAR